MAYQGKSEEIIRYLNQIIPQAEIKSLRFEDISKIN